MKSDILIPKCTKGRGRAGVTDLRRIPKETRIILTPSLKWINQKAVCPQNRSVEKELKVRVPSREMDLQRLKCLHPPSSPLSLIMLQIILKIILEII